MSHRKTIRVLVADAGKRCHVQEIPDTLEAMQAIVGGYIEHVDTLDPGIDIWANEEGLLKGLPPNRNLGLNVIVGPILVTACNKSGNAVSLSDEQIKIATAVLDPEKS